MDPLCHTLVGAALAETGPRRQTRFAVAGGVIGANLPDVDVFAVMLGPMLGVRRGWTHGVVALVILPLLLTGLLLLLARWRRRRTDGVPVRAGPLLALVAAAVLTHPLLDWMNVYGMRWLMPFDGSWTAADTLFIIDPILYLILGVALFPARRREQGMRWARGGLALAVLYIATQLAVTGVARTTARADAPAGAAAPVIVVPLALRPLARDILVDGGTVWIRGSVRGFPDPTVAWVDSVPKGLEVEVLDALEATREGRAWFDWARAPFAERLPGGGWRLGDLRYGHPGQDGWATLHVERVHPIRPVLRSGTEGTPRGSPA